jgi:hypothetical protein
MVSWELSSCLHSSSHISTDLCGPASTSPQPNEGSCGLEDTTVISDGDVRDLTYESSSWKTTEVAESSDEEPSGDFDDGGVTIL